MKGIVQHPETKKGFYTFYCVECDTFQTNPTDERAISVLSALNIPVTIKLTEKEIDNFSVQLDTLEDIVGAIQDAKKNK